MGSFVLGVLFLSRFVFIACNESSLTIDTEQVIHNFEPDLGASEIHLPVIDSGGGGSSSEGGVSNNDVATPDLQVENIDGHQKEQTDVTNPKELNVTPENSTQLEANHSLTKTVNESENVTVRVACNRTNVNVGLPVELVNSSRLANILIPDSNITDRQTTADCALVLFYARFCPFSSMAAPHFNAMARAFPSLKIAAVDAMKYHGFNTQYGIVGVPTIMLFHNGRPAAKYNDSEYTLEMFAKFITKYTGIEPQDKLYVTSADFGGPVSSVPTKETDYCLLLSWAFMFICGLYFFSKSSWWRWMSEAIQNTWREAEAQHEHGD